MYLQRKVRPSIPREWHIGKPLTWPGQNYQSLWCPSLAPPKTDRCSSMAQGFHTGSHLYRTDELLPWFHLKFAHEQKRKKKLLYIIYAYYNEDVIGKIEFEILQKPNIYCVNHVNGLFRFIYTRMQYLP